MFSIHGVAINPMDQNGKSISISPKVAKVKVHCMFNSLQFYEILFQHSLTRKHTVSICLITEFFEDCKKNNTLAIHHNSISSNFIVVAVVVATTVAVLQVFSTFILSEHFACPRGNFLYTCDAMRLVHSMDWLAKLCLLALRSLRGLDI